MREEMEDDTGMHGLELSFSDEATQRLLGPERLKTIVADMASKHGLSKDYIYCKLRRHMKAAGCWTREEFFVKRIKELEK
jgi:hypothetical protein